MKTLKMGGTKHKSKNAGNGKAGKRGENQAFGTS